MESLIGIALWALIPGFVARKKGRSFWGYYFLSFLISPLISMIITFCLKNLNKISEDTTNNEAAYQSNGTSPQVDGWQCSCGRTHPKYETSCVCGKSKYDNITPPTLEDSTDELSQTTDKVLFCRKCGEKLIDGSRFCRKCGTEVVELPQ